MLNMKRQRSALLSAAVALLHCGAVNGNVVAVNDKVSEEQHLRGLHQPSFDRHLRAEDNAETLYACIGRYPGYNLELGGWVNPNGNVRIIYFEDGGQSGTEMLFEHEIYETEDHCDECRIHIATGMTCEDADRVGNHYWNREVLDEDPWTRRNSAYYNSNNNGKAIGAFEVDNGYSFEENLGHAIIVYAMDGRTRIGCGVLQPLKKGMHCDDNGNVRHDHTMPTPKSSISEDDHDQDHNQKPKSEPKKSPKRSSSVQSRDDHSGSAASYDHGDAEIIYGDYIDASDFHELVLQHAPQQYDSSSGKSSRSSDKKSKGGSKKSSKGGESKDGEKKQKGGGRSSGGKSAKRARARRRQRL